MAALVCKLSAKQKADLQAGKRTLLSVPQDTFWLDPSWRPWFMDYLWDRQELGLETFELAVMESDKVMREVEIVP